MSDLSFKQKNCYQELSEQEQETMNRFCEEYKDFLTCAKTERFGVQYAVRIAAQTDTNRLNTEKPISREIKYI